MGCLAPVVHPEPPVHLTGGAGAGMGFASAAAPVTLHLKPTKYISSPPPAAEWTQPHMQWQPPSGQAGKPAGIWKPQSRLYGQSWLTETTVKSSGWIELTSDLYAMAMAAPLTSHWLAKLSPDRWSEPDESHAYCAELRPPNEVMLLSQPISACRVPPAGSSRNWPSAVGG